MTCKRSRYRCNKCSKSSKHVNTIVPFVQSGAFTNRHLHGFIQLAPFSEYRCRCQLGRPLLCLLAGLGFGT